MDKKAIFWDRDGVINKAIIKNGKPYSPRKIEEFILSDCIESAIQKSHVLGYFNIIVSNQPDIARGLLNWDIINEYNNIIKKKLLIDDICICPHDNKDNCNCRKPKPGLITASAKKWNINLHESFIVGDQWKDIDAGKIVGCTTILISAEYNKDVKSDFRITTVLDTIQIID